MYLDKFIFRLTKKVLDICPYISYYFLYGLKRGDYMPRTGRPTANKKTLRLEIRLTPNEAAVLQECADKLEISKTEVINKGIALVKAELDKK